MIKISTKKFVIKLKESKTKEIFGVKTFFLINKKEGISKVEECANK